MDAKIGDNWRIGAASISQSEVSVDALQTHVATVSLAPYAGGSVGPVALAEVALVVSFDKALGPARASLVYTDRSAGDRRSSLGSWLKLPLGEA